MKKISITVVVPVYSGEDYLEKLVAELDSVKNTWQSNNAPFFLDEAIFVDDSAIDRSADTLSHLSSKHCWLRVIHLSRNYGQHPATIAGILHSSGEWVVTLDEDLQHPPREIEQLLRKAVTCGDDIVYANAADKVHELHVRDLGSKFYKKFIAIMTGNRKVTEMSSFRLIRGDIARAASAVCSHDSYFDIVLMWFSQRVSSVSLSLKDLRVIGGQNSGYNLHKLLFHARRLLLTAHTKILRISALIGIVAMMASVIYGVWVFIVKLFYPEQIPVEGWTSLFLMVLFFGGLTTFLLGLLLEYFSIMLQHMQGKPTFFIVNRENDNLIQPYFSRTPNDSPGQ